MSAPETPTNFASALAAVTGVQVDLRGAASPAGGWITFGSPGWWTYAPFGSPLFTVGLNLQALTDRAFAVSGLDGVADELAAGTAEGEIFTIVDDLTSNLSGYYDTLAGPPPIADALHAAGEALAAFGRGMAGAYGESALHSAASDGVNGIAANMQNYLFGQPVTTETVTQVLAGYSSSAVGALPSGMADFSGDLAQPAVWSAASSAVTNRILAKLDTLDTRAAELASVLKDAYQTATDRLNGVSGKGPQNRFRRSEQPQAGEPLAGRTNRRPESQNQLTPGLEGRSTPGVRASNGTPGQPLAARSERQDASEPRPGVVRQRQEASDPLTPKTRQPGEVVDGVPPQPHDHLAPGEPLSGMVDQERLAVSHQPVSPGGPNTGGEATPTPEGVVMPGV